MAPAPPASIEARDRACSGSRAATPSYATALLTEAVNAIRAADEELVIPQLDYRLWKTYHATCWPHHLTRTIMY